MVIGKVIQVCAADKLCGSPCKCDGSCFGSIAIVIIGPARIGIAAVVCDTVYNRAEIVRSGCTIFRQRCRRCHIGALGIDCLCHADSTGYWQRFLSENSHCAVNGHNIALCCKLVLTDGVPCNCKFTAESAVCQHAIYCIRQCRQASGHGDSGNIAHGNDIGNDMQLGGNSNVLHTAELQCALDGVVTCCVIGICRNLFPCNGTIYSAAICKCTGCLGLQRGLRACLNSVVTHHGIADKAFLRLFGNGCGCYGSAATGQSGGGYIDSKAACILCGAHNDQCLARICRNVGRGRAGEHRGLLILGSGCLVTVIHADNLAIAGQGEVDGIGSCGIQIAVGIGNIDRDICKAAAVRKNLRLVSLYIQLADCARRGNRSIAAGLCDLVSAFVVCLCGNRTCFIYNIKGRIQTARSGSAHSFTDTGIAAAGCVGIICMPCICRIDGTCCCSNQHTVAIQLNLRRVGVNDNWSFPVVGQHVIAVPRGYQMQSIVILIPLAAV